MFVPAIYDVVWSLVVVAHVVLLLLALARWSRVRASHGGGLVDVLVIVLVPVVGPAAYLWGRRGIDRPGPEGDHRRVPG